MTIRNCFFLYLCIISRYKYILVYVTENVFTGECFLINISISLSMKFSFITFAKINFIAIIKENYLQCVPYVLETGANNFLCNKMLKQAGIGCKNVHRKRVKNININFYMVLCILTKQFTYKVFGLNLIVYGFLFLSDWFGLSLNIERHCDTNLLEIQ